jgi:hypothetical protein
VYAQPRHCYTYWPTGEGGIARQRLFMSLEHQTTRAYYQMTGDCVVSSEREALNLAAFLRFGMLSRCFRMLTICYIVKHRFFSFAFFAYPWWLSILHACPVELWYSCMCPMVCLVSALQSRWGLVAVDDTSSILSSLSHVCK